MPIVCPSAGALEGKEQAQGDKLAGMEVRVGMLGQVPNHAINTQEQGNDTILQALAHFEIIGKWHATLHPARSARMLLTCVIFADNTPGKSMPLFFV